MPEKYLIVGLGNPGRKYRNHRHNLGFLALDALADTFGCRFETKRCSAQLAQTMVAGKTVYLAKPQLYMNRSGEAIACLAAFYGIEAENILIIVDDADLPLGVMRLRRSGGSGGHNGLKSVIAHLQTQSFPRLRIGIGRPAPDKDMIEFVLSDLSPSEWEVFKGQFIRLSQIVTLFLQNGVDYAMNKCNMPEAKPE